MESKGKKGKDKKGMSCEEFYFKIFFFVKYLGKKKKKKKEKKGRNDDWDG